MAFRDFIKFLSLLLVLAYSMLFTLVWVNAYTFGYHTTIFVDKLGEANLEGLVLFAVFWPVVSVGLYFVAVDAGVLSPGGSAEANDAGAR